MEYMEASLCVTCEVRPHLEFASTVWNYYLDQRHYTERRPYTDVLSFFKDSDGWMKPFGKLTNHCSFLKLVFNFELTFSLRVMADLALFESSVGNF